MDTGKEKAKPAFKLQSDVEHSTDVAGVVNHYILVHTIEIPLKTLPESRERMSLMICWIE